MHRLAIFILATTVCMAADTSLERLTPVNPVFDSQSVTHSAKPVPEVQKTVNITTEEIRFAADRFQLAGVLVRPEGEGPHPAIIFIHGDGPVNRDGYGVYRPIWKRFVEMGYACLSWDKPGVGQSSGTFTPHATYEERAGIVREAIHFLKERTDIDATRIGLWSISQAGYVAPMVCAGNPDVAFLIAVSTPTVNPIEQTAHLIEQEIRRSGLGDAAARTYA